MNITTFYTLDTDMMLEGYRAVQNHIPVRSPRYDQRMHRLIRAVTGHSFQELLDNSENV